METKIIEGYVIYDLIDNIYISENEDYCDFNSANVYDDIEDAKEDIEECLDGPENYEIHKVKLILETEAIYKRKVNYEIVEGKVE